MQRILLLVTKPPRKPRRPKQLKLAGHGGWGGKRKGAGRKPTGARAGVSHKARPRLRGKDPVAVHVTMRVAPHVWNLRGPKTFPVIQEALGVAADRFGVRIVHFSVQSNHMHLIVEAKTWPQLSSAMKGLSIRIAKGLNKVMACKGRVFADRYHAHVLRTPTEARRAIAYLKNNRRKHAAAFGKVFPEGWVDPYSSEAPTLGITLPAPESWLLLYGWRRAAA